MKSMILQYSMRYGFGSDRRDKWYNTSLQQRQFSMFRGQRLRTLLRNDTG